MRTPLRPRTYALIALGMGLLASFAAWFLAGRQADGEARAQFANQAQLATNIVERRIQRYVDLLYGMEAYMANRPDLARADFNRHVAALQAAKRFPGVQALQFIRRVPGEDLQAYVQRVRADRSLAPSGYPFFDIRPPGARPEHWVIDFMEPMAGNEPAFGMDLHALAAPRAAMENARDTGEPVSTGRYRLVQERGQSFGQVIYLPVFGPAPPRSLAQRRAAIRGWVNVVLRIDDVFAETLASPLFSGLRLAMHDVGAVGKPALAPVDKQTLFYRIDPADAAAKAAPPFALRLHHDARLQVAGRQWLLRFDAVPPPVSAWLSPLPLLALGAGLTVTLLLFGIIEAFARTRGEAIALAKSATRDLRAQLSFNQQLLEAIPYPVYFKDVQGRYLGCNRAFEVELGIARERLVGLTPYDIMPREFADRLLADDHKVFEQGGIHSMETEAPRPSDGAMRKAIFTKATFQDGDGNVAGLVGVIVDTTQRKEAERALRESEERLRLAMDAARMGLWYWDAQADEFTYSDGLNPLFGRPREAAHTTYQALQAHLPDDDRELFAATIRHAVKQGTDFQVDFRVTWPDGSVHWLANHGQVHREDGRALRIVGVAMDITERKLAEQRIAHMAHHDALTGLPNRVLLHDRIRQAIAQAHRGGTHVAVLFIDLDRFKTINDSLGHAFGDRLLQSVASRILVCLREGDTVSRLGGDEFVIVIPSLNGSGDAAGVASKILEVLGNSFHLMGQDLHVSASIGISLYPTDGTDAETLTRHADTAMYHAKDTGRAKFQFFTPHMNVAAQQRLVLENALRRAIDNHEFELHYQPLYDLRDRSITGLEALLRWHPPGEEPVPPAEFIGVAEESGLIVPIGDWALREALKQAKSWQAAGRSLLVAINVSAVQLARPNFVERLRRILHETALDPALVELEVTERLIVEGSSDARSALDQIAALGVGIAIDDFGTGYSGLAYLKRLPIDTVKIDQSFIRELTIDPDDAAIVTAIVAMAHSLGIDVVAEGVETEAQLESLQRLGCHRAQGYLLGRPMSARDITKLLGEAPASAAAD